MFSLNFISISTHTPLARRDLTVVLPVKHCRISTHTPLARRDMKIKSGQEKRKISTHTPLARRDVNKFNYVFGDNNFYSHASCEA